jgi:hypothetical protein
MKCARLWALRTAIFLAKVKNETSVKNEPLFRHWIEVRELKEESVRQLSLKTAIRICLTIKQGGPDHPRQKVF